MTLYNVGGFVCQEQEANDVDMLLLTQGCAFITRASVAVKALDKSFILQIPAKTKARESCHFPVLTCLKENEGKDLANAPLSTSFSSSHPVCLSLSFCLHWQLSLAPYNGSGFLWRDRLPLPYPCWWREDRGVWIRGKNRTWRPCCLQPVRFIGMADIIGNCSFLQINMNSRDDRYVKRTCGSEVPKIDGAIGLNLLSFWEGN